MDKLKEFTLDVAMKDTVKEHILVWLKNAASEAALNGDSTNGFKEAKEALDSAFWGLEKMYAVKEEPRDKGIPRNT